MSAHEAAGVHRARAILRAFGPDIRKRRKPLWGGVGFAVIYALTRVFEPWPLKVVFDQVLFHKKAKGFLTKSFFIFGHSPTDLLWAAALALGISGLIRGVAYYYQDYMLSKAAQQIVYGIRTRLYRHLHVLPASFYQRRRTGDLLMRLSSDIILLRDVLVDFIVNLGSGAVLVLLMLVVMILVDPVLTLVSLGVMPAIVLLSWLYGRRIRSNATRQRKKEGQVATVMHEALSAMSVVQLHGAEDREQERFHELNRRSLKQGVKGARLEASMNRSVELAISGGTVVILFAGTLRALHGDITPGELIVFVSYLRQAYRPLRRASKSVQRSAKALAAAERIIEILAVKPALADAPDAQPAPAFAGEIAFEHVDFAYDPGRDVLHDVSFSVPAGRRVAIVGTTGSGKSTLLSLVPRLFDPAAGHVHIDGGDVRSYTLESLRAQISSVQQESILFGLTVAENIRYGRPDATDEEVREAAHAAGMDDFVELLPEGYDTVLAERGASLSGGQRQRVAIARALVRRSPILILDEPTSGLDAATERGIIDALRGLMASTTTLLVTHHMSLVREADDVIVVEHGRIVAQGSYDDLLQRSPEFRRLAAPRGRDRSRERAADGARVTTLRTRDPDGGPRVLFYSHNGVGVGHLQRQLALAGAYKSAHPSAAVLTVTGSHAAGLFPIPPGIDYVKLPALKMVDRLENWKARDLPISTREVVALRRELLEQTVRRFAPDLLVADFLPAGPYGELLPALETLTARGGAAVAGFRDVIDAPAFVRDLWRRTGVYEVLRDHYRTICVYGDPATVDFAPAYGLDDELASRVRYCGYLGRRPPTPPEPISYTRPLVIANGGGGADGGPMLERFVDAAALHSRRRGGTWLLVTGPLMDHGTRDRLAARARDAGVAVRHVIPELRAHIALADCVVSMAGYNTCCDVLAFRRPTVLVPRPGPNLEQSIRAGRLAEWGAARSVALGDASPARLSAAIADALDGPAPPPAPVPLDGLDAAVAAFEETLAAVGVAA